MTSQNKFNMPLEVSGPDSEHTQVTAELVFDSFRDPSPGGVRSTASAVRYLLYRADLFVVELRLEFVSGSRRYSLAGQVLNCQEGAAPLNKVPVHLRSGPDELALTMTNDFGEFCLDYETGKNVHIWVAVGNKQDIIILLDETFWRTSPAR